MMSNKLTHADLITLSDILGLPHEGGLCRGFSLTLAQAILADDENTFWRRIKFLADNKNDFLPLINKIIQARVDVKEKKDISKHTVELLEVLAFYDTISLYHLPNKYGVFGESFVPQQNFHAIYPLAKSQQLENTKLSIALNKAHVFDRVTLTNYIRDLGSVMINYANIPIIMDSVDHSVIAKYQPENPEKPWMYVDTNDFMRYPDHPEYYRELTDEELANSLFVSLGSNPSPNEIHHQSDSEYLAINTTIIVDEAHPLNKNRSLENLNSKYKIDSTHVNKFDYSGVGILYLACCMGYLELVKELIQIPGIEINKINKDGNGLSALHVACQQGHIKVVKALIEAPDINIDLPLARGETPFYIACQNGHVNIVKVLLEKGVNKRERKDGMTPLHAACQNGRFETVEALLQIPWDMEKKAINGNTPFLCAVFFGNNSLIERLLKVPGVNINDANNTGISPLIWVCDSGNLKMVDLFLKNGANVNQAMSDGSTPFLIACQHNNPNLVMRLLDVEGIEIHKPNYKGETPFLTACKEGYLEVVKELLQMPEIIEKINMRDRSRNTPLSIACTNNQVNIVNALLQIPAMFELDDVFFLACKNGNTEIVKLFLSRKDLDINVKDTSISEEEDEEEEEKDDETPLFIASNMGHVDVVKLLLQRKDLELDKPKSNGVTALYIACQNGNTDIAQLLLAHHANVNVVGIQGYTPLLVACLATENTKGKPELFSILLQYEANLFQKNDKGEMAFDIAFSKNNDTAMHEILLYAKNKEIALDTIMSPEAFSKLNKVVNSNQSSNVAINNPSSRFKFI